MSATRRLGKAAYRRMVEAAPAAAIDSIDNQAVRVTARRAHTRDLRAASDWSRQIKVPSKWYATDGSHRFYFFRRTTVQFMPGWHAFGRLPTTVYGDNAAVVRIFHGGQLTDRRPSGWMSAATLAGIKYGGLDGGPRDWGWTDNEDLDLDIRTVERMRAQDDRRFNSWLQGAYVQHLSDALERV